LSQTRSRCSQSCTSEFARELKKQMSNLRRSPVLTLLLMMCLAADSRGAEKRPFTLADDIGISIFGDPYMGQVEAITFSPDRQFIVVSTFRGRVDLNRSESKLRFYRSTDIQECLARGRSQDSPHAFWTLSKSTYVDGPIITNIRWLADSTGIGFLLRNELGLNQLVLAELRTRTAEVLSPANENVTAFDIRSRHRFAFAALSRAIRERALKEERAPSFLATGRTFESLTLPLPRNPSITAYDLSEVWAHTNGRTFRIIESSTGQPLPIHLQGQWAFAISPDGRSLVTALTVSDVPLEWESLYRPSFPTSPDKIRAGLQDPRALAGQWDVSEYVLVDLLSGRTKSLLNAPIGNAAGWWGTPQASWSPDSRSVVVTNSFLPIVGENSIERTTSPCVAVVDTVHGNASCLEPLVGSTENGYRDGTPHIESASFEPGMSDRVVVRYSINPDRSQRNIMNRTYLRSANDGWRSESITREAAKQNTFDIFVDESPNDPPVLVAKDGISGRSRVIWDPNPDLRSTELGRVSVLEWKDKTGRDWVGGLYHPPDFSPDRRYPLVIQTHGFAEHQFFPSGAYPTAFAAQELAEAGFVVLQLRDCPVRGTSEEGPCQVAGYEAAVEQLTREGLVDPNRVGIIGFSRTCFYVLQALTTSRIDFRAASITDGVNEGYLQYMLAIDQGDNAIAREADAMIGAAPFGEGLREWLKHSPGFNLDRVTTPLHVVATTRGVVEMWEPYAVLRYLNKPVELTVLNSYEHVLTNPAVRMASQGGTVDWFRFWLQGYEDADPAKAGQYKRWEELCDSQRAQHPTGSDVCIGTRRF
jgi:dipeptidyl aminopeptidase/acylaminoacyl peptidase